MNQEEQINRKEKKEENVKVFVHIYHLSIYPPYIVILNQAIFLLYRQSDVNRHIILLLLHFFLFMAINRSAWLILRQPHFISYRVRECMCRLCPYIQIIYYHNIH